jgi:hypothetical protein
MTLTLLHPVVVAAKGGTKLFVRIPAGATVEFEYVLDDFTDVVCDGRDLYKRRAKICSMPHSKQCRSSRDSSWIMRKGLLSLFLLAGVLIANPAFTNQTQPEV